MFFVVNVFQQKESFVSWACRITPAERSMLLCMLYFSAVQGGNFAPKMLLSAEMLNMLHHAEPMLSDKCFFLQIC